LEYHFIKYKRSYWIAPVWLVVFLLLRINEVKRLIEGNTSFLLNLLLFFQLVLIPVIFILLGYYLSKKVLILSNDKLIMKSLFSEKIISWNDINKIIINGTVSKIVTETTTITFEPKHYSSSSEKLISEIKAKAANAS